MGELTYKRGYTTDESFEALIEQELDRSEQPTFLFAITMQNHQPFSALPEEEITLNVSSDCLSQENLDAVTTYTQGLRDADRMLGRLADYVDSCERPTLLIFFGDHKPTLGANWSAYDQCGYFSAADNYNLESRKKMYSTPFLFYANRPLNRLSAHPLHGAAAGLLRRLPNIQSAAGYGNDAGAPGIHPGYTLYYLRSVDSIETIQKTSPPARFFVSSGETENGGEVNKWDFDRSGH